MSLIDKQIDVIYPYDFMTTFQTVVTAAQNMKGFSFRGVDNQNYIVHLGTRVSAMSWGERITISCMQVDNYNTAVRIKSAPVVPTTLIDFGRNSRIVRKVQAALDAYLRR